MVRTLLRGRYRLMRGGRVQMSCFEARLSIASFLILNGEKEGKRNFYGKSRQPIFYCVVFFMQRERGVRTLRSAYGNPRPRLV